MSTPDLGWKYASALSGSLSDSTTIIFDLLNVSSDSASSLLRNPNLSAVISDSVSRLGTPPRKAVILGTSLEKDGFEVGAAEGVGDWVGSEVLGAGVGPGVGSEVLGARVGAVGLTVGAGVGEPVDGGSLRSTKA